MYINLTSKQFLYRSQSGSTSTDNNSAGAEMESLLSQDKAVKYFEDSFAEVPLSCLLNELDISIQGLEKSICNNILPDLGILEKGCSTNDLRSARKDYEQLLEYKELRKVLVAKVSVKTAGVQIPEPKSENSKSVDKESETEKRRLKTQIVNTSRWESLDWNVPLKGFNHINDYTMEYNARLKLTDGSSSRISKLRQWHAKAKQMSNRIGYITKPDKSAVFGGSKSDGMIL